MRTHNGHNGQCLTRNVAGRQSRTEVIICLPYVGHKISADQKRGEHDIISTRKARLPHPSLGRRELPHHDYISTFLQRPKPGRPYIHVTVPPYPDDSHFPLPVPVPSTSSSGIPATIRSSSPKRACHAFIPPSRMKTLHFESGGSAS